MFSIFIFAMFHNFKVLQGLAFQFSKFLLVTKSWLLTRFCNEHFTDRSDALKLKPESYFTMSLLATASAHIMTNHITSMIG